MVVGRNKKKRTNWSACSTTAYFFPLCSFSSCNYLSTTSIIFHMQATYLLKRSNSYILVREDIQFPTNTKIYTPIHHDNLHVHFDIPTPNLPVNHDISQNLPNTLTVIDCEIYPHKFYIRKLQLLLPFSYL